MLFLLKALQFPVLKPLINRKRRGTKHTNLVENEISMLLLKKKIFQNMAKESSLQKHVLKGPPTLSEEGAQLRQKGTFENQ